VKSLFSSKRINEFAAHAANAAAQQTGLPKLTLRATHPDITKPLIGTFISHAGAIPFAVLALPIPMVQTRFFALPVATVDPTTALFIPVLSTLVSAVPVPPIAALADIEILLTPNAFELVQNLFVGLSHRANDGIGHNASMVRK
jgi:hypothetical protein